MAFSWASLVPDLLGGIKQYFSRKHEVRMKTLDLKFKVTEAKVLAEIQMQQQRQNADIDWEKISIANSGWKDEWFTVFLSLMMVAMFIPSLQPFMIDGFIALKEHTPMWLSAAFLGAVGSSFGIRMWTNFTNLAGGTTGTRKMLKESKDLNKRLLEHLEAQDNRRD